MMANRDERKKQKNEETDQHTLRYSYPDSGKRNSEWAQENYRQIVKEMDGYDINEMLEFIGNIPGENEVHSAIVFRAVVEAQVVDDWALIKRQLEKSKMLIKCYKLLDGLFCISTRTENKGCSTEGSSSNEGKLEDQVLSPELQDLLDAAMDARTYDDDVEFAIQFIESFYAKKDYKSRRTAKEHVYYYNSDDAVKEFPFLLNSIKNSGLSYEKNPHIGEFAGINSPMFYLGGLNTFTAVHIEDGLTDSINVLRSGSPKLWIIVEYRDYVKLNDALGTLLYGDENTKRPNIDYNKQLCRLPTHHKDLMLTPKLLDDNAINYRFVMQWPGDGIFVRNGVAHQVWNIGENFAEAINYGSVRWKAMAPAMHCKCRLNHIREIHASSLSNYRIFDRNQNKLANFCPLPGCEKFFSSNTEVENHLLQSKDHNVMMYCLYCDKTSRDASNMGKHQKLHHNQTLKDYKLLYYCLRRLIAMQYFERESVVDVPSDNGNDVDIALQIKRLKHRHEEILITAAGEHAALSLLDEIHDMYGNKHKCDTIDEAIAHFTKVLPEVKNF